MDPERLARWAASRRRVGGRIRALRLQAGLTQEALALESGLSRNQLIELEHGRRGVLFERLEDVAECLGVPVGDLFLVASEVADTRGTRDC